VKPTRGGEIVMHKIPPLALVILMLFFQCTSGNKQSSDNSREALHKTIPRCDINSFTQAVTEHIIDEIEQPFLVKTVKGKIVNSIDREWAEDSRVLFEIRGIDREKKIRHTYADNYGVFEMSNVPEGRYCFKATGIGWDSVMGVIIVSKTANPNNEIVFEMKLGT
jgi:hypothetical protein